MSGEIICTCFRKKFCASSTRADNILCQLSEVDLIRSLEIDRQDHLNSALKTKHLVTVDFMLACTCSSQDDRDRVQGVVPQFRRLSNLV